MLCTMVINGLANALDVLSLVPGKDFEIVTVSFDPRDTAATATAKKTGFIGRYKQPGAAAAWHRQAISRRRRSSPGERTNTNLYCLNVKPYSGGKSRRCLTGAASRWGP
jgi:hypothetical protein